MAARLRLSASQILGSVLTHRSNSASAVAVSAAVRFATDRHAYRAGEQGAVTVRNASSQIVRLNLCPRQLEQQLGDAWVVRDRSPGPGEICATASVLLPSGATSGASFRLPRGLAPGMYRWRFLGLVAQGGVPLGAGERLTNSFGIEA